MGLLKAIRDRPAMRVAQVLNAIGFGIGIGVLVMCIESNPFGNYPDTCYAPFLLLLALILIAGGAALAFLWKRYLFGLITLAFWIALLQLSDMPLYAPHSFPTAKPGGGYHHHSIWELGHVH